MKASLWLTALSLCLLCGCRPAAAPEDTSVPVSVMARVEAVSAGRSVDHFDDGSFAVRDAIIFAVISPAHFADRRLTVYVDPEQLPAESSLRKVGSRCTFAIDPSVLDADEIHWGALQGLRVSDPPQGT